MSNVVVGGFDMFFGPTGGGGHHHHDGFGHGMDAGGGEEFIPCGICGFAGCDVRVSSCGCTSHARCLPLHNNPSSTAAAGGGLHMCPLCLKPCTGLVLLPMSFREIDDAQRTIASMPASATSKQKSRKRKSTTTTPMSTSSSSSDLPPEASLFSQTLNERRTGRWTTEEMAYCDALMEKFGTGELPVCDGVKLNEFLGNMLKSKQSRLTKKMKNAKLSSRVFQRTTGYLTSSQRDFSQLEESFFQSVVDVQERAEIRFQMQKEWREQFSRVCLATGQALDSDVWLTSVEEMDRRASQAKDTARMTRRKLMMGVAMHADSKNMPKGVFMEKTDAEERVVGVVHSAEAEQKDIEKEMLSMLAHDKYLGAMLDSNEQSSLLHSAPFLAKVTSYMQRHGVPFEHCDLWVPSFVPGQGADGTEVSTCRLCYAGNSTTHKVMPASGAATEGTDLTQDELFNFYSFGDYSQKFSFNIGSGLPGRVYDLGRPIWEQSVHKAQQQLFERCGGADQWGIKTVVGIPIASPNVGRIVVVLYSREDRKKDEDLVTRLSDEFTRLMPCPKWKLVVDIGEVEDHQADKNSSILEESSVTDAFDPVPSGGFKSHESSAQVSMEHSYASEPKDTRADQVVSILGKYMPSDPLSQLAHYVPGFMSLRLLLLRSSRSAEEEELVKTMLDSYSSYASGGRDESDIAVMLARDYTFLSQQQQHQQPPNNGMEPLGAQLQQQQGHHHHQHHLHHASMSARGDHNNAEETSDIAAAASGNNNSTTETAGLSLFGLPSIRSNPNLHLNSPALTPIPAGESNIELLSLSGDCLSVVSH